MRTGPDRGGPTTPGPQFRGQPSPGDPLAAARLPEHRPSAAHSSRLGRCRRSPPPPGSPTSSGAPSPGRFSSSPPLLRGCYGDCGLRWPGPLRKRGGAGRAGRGPPAAGVAAFQTSRQESRRLSRRILRSSRLSSA
uniref:Collagen alpha-4(IV) chain-like n=1 Tax=Phascolarctos cinereus TaxID=38626 RepID=A0A6P5M3N3_PHACI|nr:collagen alpha-4(IV) chain-like [Phascolarctos cinereus]XP_020865224.1 collagen alpha-4(IV) chain-like [Phascolarctos cinereus]XP_020865225.1 collagen alpha-4(IV) chain-like [Phascolarctos cinereus]